MNDSTSTSPCAECAPISIPPQLLSKLRSPRVVELLRSNNPPLDLEMAEIRAAVGRQSSILSELDRKMAHAKQTLDDMAASRALVQSHLTDSKTILHPIRSAPNEVLGEIFRQCVFVWRGNGFGGEADSLNPAVAPWTVSHVCRKWRNLAINTPSLWAHLQLDFDSHEDITHLQCAYKTGLYLGRSGQLSVDISIYGDTESLAGHPVLPMLQLSVHRWKRFYLNSSVYALECFANLPFPRLSHFSLAAYSDDEETHLVPTFQGAGVPSLRHLGVHAWSVYERLSVPWSRITHLEVFADFDDEAWKYLSQMTRLEHLHVACTDIHAPDAIPHLVLPHLISIHIELHADVAGFTRIDDIVTALNAPLLFKMSLSFCDSDGYASHYPKSSASVLTTVRDLNIDTCTANDPQNVGNLLAFLSSIPQLEALHLHNCHMSTEFVQGMTLTESTKLLPRLRVLDLSECFCDEYLSKDVDILWVMLSSRSVAPGATVSGAGVDQKLAVVGLGNDATESWTPLQTAILPPWIYCERGEERWSQVVAAIRLECGVDGGEADSEDESDATK